MTLLMVNGGWGDAAIPYVVDEATFTSAELAIVEQGIAQWNADDNSPTSLVPRTAESDYLNFRRHQTACNSPIGRRGGRQEVLCATGPQNFQFGAVMHEIGHVMGLYHEQKRADRDNFVTVAAGAPAVNYAIVGNDTVAAFGSYDLGSIMHYPPNNLLSVDVVVPPGVIVGQRNALSAGDKLGLTWLTRDFFRETGSLRRVAVASDGAVWGVNAFGNVYNRAFVDREWTEVDGSLASISCAAGGQVWGTSASGAIFRRNNAANKWDRVPGSLRSISAADDGSVWGVNGDDEVFQRSGNGWRQVDGRLRRISAATGSVWGVNEDDDVYTWTGNGWRQVAGSLRWVSAATDGTVWGVNGEGDIFIRNMTSTWSRVSGSLWQISVGSFNMVMGVNAQGRVFSYRL